MTGLFWNADGLVQCAEHAPRRDTEPWRLDQWEPMGPETVAIFTDEEGRPPECETCAEQARRERR